MIKENINSDKYFAMATKIAVSDICMNPQIMYHMIDGSVEEAYIVVDHIKEDGIGR